MRMLAPTIVLALLSGCITEEEFKSVMKERDDARARITKLEDELDQSKGRVKELEKELDKSREKVPTRPPEAQIAAAYSELRLTKGGKLRAIFDTTQGEITCELFPHIAPMTVLNFVGLAEGAKEWTDPTSGMKTTQPLYDGTKFHRVIKGFMIQGGDPLGTGRGGPGYMFGDEVWPDIRFDRPGILAMANAGPGTNGSQFFITGAAQAHLNGKHTIFGKCDVETVDKIMSLPVGGESGSAPVPDVVVNKLTIERVAAPE